MLQILFYKNFPDILIVARDRHIGLSLALIRKLNSMGKPSSNTMGLC